MTKINPFKWSITGIILTSYLFLSGCNETSSPTGNYPITPVPFTSVTITDDFWGPGIKRNHEVTIPIAFHQSEITGRIKNFEVAGGLTESTFSSSHAYDDSDVYKIIEGASYSLQTMPDPELETYLDLARFFLDARGPDGQKQKYKCRIPGGNINPLPPIGITGVREK